MPRSESTPRKVRVSHIIDSQHDKPSIEDQTTCSWFTCHKHVVPALVSTLYWPHARYGALESYALVPIHIFKLEGRDCLTPSVHRCIICLSLDASRTPPLKIGAE